ncbi:MAG: hypothetical protein IJT36_08180 [Alphaproteobacteria bacterium]|nr:hypothetical protein [Alphaproteobacteria bacterium]
MIQQITNTKVDKQILNRIAYASCLNLFHINFRFYALSFGNMYAMSYLYNI